MYDKNNINFKYVCPSCFSEWKKCSCSMYPMQLIQIDKNILPIIRELNSKCYFTTSCCEGHIDDSEFMYIIFKANYKFKTFPKGFKCTDCGISTTIVGKSAQAKKRKKRQLLNTLYEWACQLESRGKTIQEILKEQA